MRYDKFSVRMFARSLVLEGVCACAQAGGRMHAHVFACGVVWCACVHTHTCMCRNMAPVCAFCSLHFRQ